MQFLKTVFRVIWAIMRSLLGMMCLPLAHVATDRIGALQAYSRSLDWIDRTCQQRRHWSVLRILERAARRQERMNVRGQAKFDELQRRKWERWYAYKFHAVLLLRIFAIGYGFEALGAVLHAHYPVAYPYWLAIGTALMKSMNAFWDMFPPYS